MYIKLTNGKSEKYSIGQLRRDNPQTSFPKNPSNELLEEWGVFPLTTAARPAFDSLTQSCKETEPIVIDGVWTQQWVVENKPQEEAENNIRSQRDSLLAGSDWTQVSDAPVDQEAWATYRAALRSIPEQAGFPFNVEFPEKP
jgi:hypothetical protein